MDEMTLLKAHVERVLEDHWDVRRVEKDADGDYPFRSGTAACWVRVLPGDGDAVPSSVVVFSHAAVGLRSSARLLRELNELNRAARWCKVALHDDQVVVSRNLDLQAASSASLELACRQVAAVAEDIGAMLATVYGGSTPFPPETESVGT
jgi:hypothetical protein